MYKRNKLYLQQKRIIQAHTEQQHRYTTDIKRQLALIDVSLYLTLPKSNYTFSTTQFIVPIAEKKMLRYDKTYKSNIFCVQQTLYNTISVQSNKLSYNIQLDRIKFNTNTITQ